VPALSSYGFLLPLPQTLGKRGVEASLLVCEAKQRGFQGGWPPWSQDGVREGEAGSEATVGRGKAKLSPSKKSMGK
jgi:hypothetical protein